MLSAAHPDEAQRMAARTSRRAEQLTLPIALADELPIAPPPEGATPAPPASTDGADASPDLRLELRVNRRLRTTYRWRAAAYLRRQTVRTDAALLARARRLLARYFPERPVLRAASWSPRQHKRHGSCTSGAGV